MKTRSFISVFSFMVVMLGPVVSYGDFSFNISIDGNGLGLAVDPTNGHVFVSSLAYDGGDNLYEYAPDGTLLNSTRAAFDTGPYGNLDTMVIGRDGHIFAYAVHLVQFPADCYLLEMSQDGQIIYSAVDHPSTHVGLTYDPVTDRLFYLDYVSPRNYRVMEVDSSATYFDLEEPIGGKDYYSGLAYDPVSQDFYVSEDTGVLAQYSKNGFGAYTYVRSYALPLDNIFDIDINRSTGLLYAQAGNDTVLSFSLDELDVYIPIPIPVPTPVPLPSAALLGALGLGFVSLWLRRQ